MSYKRSHEDGVADTELFPTVPKRKLDEIQLLSQSESQLSSAAAAVAVHQLSYDQSLSSSQSSSSSSVTANASTTMSSQHLSADQFRQVVHSSMSATMASTSSLMDCSDDDYIPNAAITTTTTAAAAAVDHHMTNASSDDNGDGCGGSSGSSNSTPSVHRRPVTVTTTAITSARTSAQPSGQVSDDEEDEEEDCDTDPDIIIPYLKRFQESYQTSLSIYTSRLEKLELSDALKCTNDLFAVAIDNYQKEHNGFAHKTAVDLSGVHNVRREFDELLVGAGGGVSDGQHPLRPNAKLFPNIIHNNNNNSSDINAATNSGRNTSGCSSSSGSNSYNNCNTDYTSGRTAAAAEAAVVGPSNPTDNTYGAFDEKLTKVIEYMCEIEANICQDMKKIYVSYERLLEALVMIEYRLAIIIEMFHHMTDVEPQKFLPCLPFIQNVPDLIGYINSLYDADNELPIKDESSNERMQAIVDQFRAMHKRIRDAMDGLHALSCIIMEKKTEVIDRVHTFYKKAEQIFFSQPPFVFQTKDCTSRCM